MTVVFKSIANHSNMVASDFGLEPSMHNCQNHGCLIFEPKPRNGDVENGFGLVSALFIVGE